MKDVKPIRNETDYDAALSEIERLMDAKPDTKAGDRLDVLATLVEAYEDKHWRIDPLEWGIPAESLIRPA